jgi:glycosyltransferase involved in cell wall biosynthesis
MQSASSILVSVIVPIFNELENVGLMYGELTEAMRSQHRPYELVLVDDGSRDGTTEQLQKIAACDERVKLVLFRRNYGQTAAMHAGIQNANGEYLVTIDGDLQNDPHDIPMMLEKLDAGFDLVHGWRKDRKDKLLSRKIPSRIANWLISKVTEFPIHDLGCTLKAMRADIAQQIELYGEMHRFIPILAHQLGAKSVEVVTNHRARQFGETKYGIGRTFRVVLDLITVKYMLKYFSSPMKLFGKLGLWVGGAGVLATTSAFAMKLFAGTDMTGNPLLLLGILATILSVQFFSLGLIGEVCARIYYTSEHRTNYQVRELVNFDPPHTVRMPQRRVA